MFDEIAIEIKDGDWRSAVAAWVRRARELSSEVRVTFCEGNRDHWSAIVRMVDREGYVLRYELESHERYDVTVNRRARVASVREVCPSDGTEPWRYTLVWRGAPGEAVPTRYLDTAPYLVVPRRVEDDHELFVLRTAQGAVRANVVFGMGPAFGAVSVDADRVDGPWRLEGYDPVNPSRTTDVWTRADLVGDLEYWRDQVDRDRQNIADAVVGH